MEYQKPPLSHDEQIGLLIDRGLKIPNKEKALGCLRHISYYRLSAYYLPFKQSELFKPNTKFEDILELYAFDRKLRLLVLDAIEPIEVALRAQIIYHLSHVYGTFGYLDENNFSCRFNHKDWLFHLNKQLNESSETFILHYKTKYTASQHMPLWMVMEITSFGSLSKLYRGLIGADQQEIAKQYGVPDTILASWLHVLVNVRNLCAHHARLWNRILTFKPKIPSKIPELKGLSNSHIFAVLAILEYLLLQINPESNWKKRLISLLEEHPKVPVQSMGFPQAAVPQGEVLTSSARSGS